MCIEIIEHHTDDRGIRIKHCNMLHTVGKLNFGSSIHDGHLAKAMLDIAV